MKNFRPLPTHGACLAAYYKATLTHEDTKRDVYQDVQNFGVLPGHNKKDLNANNYVSGSMCPSGLSLDQLDNLVRRPPSSDVTEVMERREQIIRELGTAQNADHAYWMTYKLRITALRKFRGMKVRNLAKATNLPLYRMKRFETLNDVGAQIVPSIEELNRILRILNMDDRQQLYMRSPNVEPADRELARLTKASYDIDMVEHKIRNKIR